MGWQYGFSVHCEDVWDGGKASSILNLGISRKTVVCSKPRLLQYSFIRANTGL